MTQHFDFRDHMRSRRPKRRWNNVVQWRQRKRRAFRLTLREITVGAAGMAATAGAVFFLPTDAAGLDKLRLAMTAGNAPAPRIERTFSKCHTGGGQNCVVDGDTFWLDGERIRIADIDTPETHPSRCAEEARLGNAATDRLHALLNAGAFELTSIDRDTDRYGRKLRIIERNGQSIGDVLVAEGLARPYSGGRRAGWCT